MVKTNLFEKLKIVLSIAIIGILNFSDARVLYAPFMNAPATWGELIMQGACLVGVHLLCGYAAQCTVWNIQDSVAGDHLLRQCCFFSSVDGRLYSVSRMCKEDGSHSAKVMGMQRMQVRKEK